MTVSDERLVVSGVELVLVLRSFKSRLNGKFVKADPPCFSKLRMQIRWNKKIDFMNSRRNRK